MDVTRDPATPAIAVARPLLPSAELLLPYLRQIDERRVYSNYGPLVRQLEARLAARFGVPAGGVAAVANGTIGLTLALSAQRPPAGSLCLTPAWTFVATAHAIRAAQLTPYFVDIDPGTWVPDPGDVAAAIAGAPGRVGAIMVVAPFGAPLDPTPWAALAERHGVALVVDSAAAFDALVPSRYPAVISLHATKIVGAGEGGAVVCQDSALTREVQRRANFGMMGSRQSTVAAGNGKMSEYHAAVTLAGLDAWPERRRQWHDVATLYRRAIGPVNGVRLRPGWGDSWLSSTCIVEFAERIATAVETRLQGCGLATRRWWADGCHREPAFADCPHGPLDETERIAASTLGLPFHLDLTAGDVARIADVLVGAARG